MIHFHCPRCSNKAKQAPPDGKWYCPKCGIWLDDCWNADGDTLPGLQPAPSTKPSAELVKQRADVYEKAKQACEKELQRTLKCPVVIHWNELEKP